MTEIVEADISKALYSRIVDSEFSGAPRLCFPGVQFHPVAGEVYLEVKNFFTSTRAEAAGMTAKNRYEGFLRVYVVAESGTNGELPYLRIAAEIATLFRRGTSLLSAGTAPRTVRVGRPPEVGTPIEDGGWLRVPVTVRWLSDNANLS